MDLTYPETLILDAGADITGQFERLESGHCKDYNTGAQIERPIAILTIDGVTRSLWLHETALRSQFKKVWPEPGETVRVQKGAAKKLGSNGLYYWPFKVTAPDRPAATLDRNSPLFATDDTDAAPASDIPADTAGFTPAPSTYGKAPGDTGHTESPSDDDIPF